MTVRKKELCKACLQIGKQKEAKKEFLGMPICEEHFNMFNNDIAVAYDVLRIDGDEDREQVKWDALIKAVSELDTDAREKS